MEFDNKRILGIDKTEDNFSHIKLIQSLQPSNKSDCKSSLKRDKLFEELRVNFWSCDLILGFFIGALQSYRTDRCLRPFPPFYINEDGKNFNDLRNICDSIPPIRTILLEPNKCSNEMVHLMSWILLEKSHPILKRIPFDSTLFPNKCIKTFKPHFVFEVCYQEKIEENWKKRIGGRNIILAYHGSTIDNFYSILKVGLQQHFSVDKEVLFGNGIYLSNEISVSAHYSPFGQTWKNSIIGSKQSVIAVCEIINDIHKVKCKDSENKLRSVNKGGLGEIPKNYFVVTDSDMVRVKYLMVYREKSVFSVKTYLGNHFLLSLLLFYVLLIIFVGLFNNLSIVKFWKWLSRLFFCK